MSQDKFMIYFETAVDKVQQAEFFLGTCMDITDDPAKKEFLKDLLSKIAAFSEKANNINK